MKYVSEGLIVIELDKSALARLVQEMEEWLPPSEAGLGGLTYRGLPIEVGEFDCLTVRLSIKRQDFEELGSWWE